MKILIFDNILLELIDAPGFAEVDLFQGQIGYVAEWILYFQTEYDVI